MMLGLSPNRVIVLGFQRTILTLLSMDVATTKATASKSVTDRFREVDVSREHLGKTKTTPG
jgi:hypothetical protein